MLIDCGTAKIYIAPIDTSDGENRRMAERRAARELVAEAFGQDTVVEHEPSGRPTIEGASISISHCSRWCALAVAPEGIGIGIDIEDKSERAQRVIRRVLRGPYAGEYVSSAKALQAWTLLEAAFKCTVPNEGLTLVDYHLPSPTGNIEGRRITLAPNPSMPLTILASRPFGQDAWISVVTSGNNS